jgi:hypothetical protein
MADPTLKLELPCPRCGMLNTPAALNCRQCAQALEAAVMPDWPQPAPFDIPGAAVPCLACGKLTAPNTDHCPHCGESPSGLGLVDDAVVKVAGAKRGRPAARRPKVGPLLNKTGWQNMAFVIRVAAVLFLIWATVDSGFWLNGVTSHLPPDSPLVLRYTTYAIYEMVRNVILVVAVWLLTMLRPTAES